MIPIGKGCSKYRWIPWVCGLAIVMLFGLFSSAKSFAWTGITTRVSVDSSGIQGSGESYEPSVSADGRFVAFYSLANNLVVGDTNNVYDIFVRDRVTNVTTRVSVDSSGIQGNDNSLRPSISGDGRFVAFYSLASNLVAGDTNDISDIFVHDRQTGQTTRVSVDSSGIQGNDGSANPSISANGQFVAFSSLASNLVEEDTNGVSDIFVHDRLTGQTTRASVDLNGIEGNGPSEYPSISGDGQIVAFSSQASNLVGNDTNGASDVFIHFRWGSTYVVSKDFLMYPGNGPSRFASISRDGQFVAFSSLASNLIAGDTNGTYDIFVYGLGTNETTLVSVGSSGIQGSGPSEYPSISGDGRFVAFRSTASNLVAGDTNGTYDIFVRDRATNETRRTSVDSSGIQSNGGSHLPSISADGRFVAFYSLAGNLVAGDSNGSRDVFMHQLLPIIAVPNDFDGDGIGDIAVWRPSDGKWYIKRTSDGGNTVVQWGTSGDIPVARDYDQDGKTDVAVWRPSNGMWYIVRSSDGKFETTQWGTSGDVPIGGLP